MLGLRTPPVVIFDAKDLGTLFEVRVAGEALQDTDVESVAYAVNHFWESLGVVVVLGHTRCGAVGATVQSVLHPKHSHAERDYPAIVESIRPSVETVLAKRPAPEWRSRDALVTACAVQNAVDKAALLRREVPSAAKRGVAIVAALYDIRSGKVRFLDRHKSLCRS